MVLAVVLLAMAVVIPLLTGGPASRPAAVASTAAARWPAAAVVVAPAAAVLGCCPGVVLHAAGVEAAVVGSHDLSQAIHILHGDVLKNGGEADGGLTDGFVYEVLLLMMGLLLVLGLLVLGLAAVRLKSSVAWLWWWWLRHHDVLLHRLREWDWRSVLRAVVNCKQRLQCAGWLRAGVCCEAAQLCCCGDARCKRSGRSGVEGI